jgi:hypothetical protein
MSKLCNVITMTLLVCAWATADAGQSYLVTDRFVGRIHRLEDLNGDGDALDSGERLLWGDGLSNAAELSRYQTGFLVLDSVAARALHYADLNGDGDALDAGESVVWTDGLSNPFGIDVAPDGSAYLSDFGTHQVFRARDNNADGDALDASEKMLYGENIQGAVSVLAEGSEQFVVAFNSGQVHMLRDTNGDGDALDVGENLPHTPNSIVWVEGITRRVGGGYYTGSWFYDTIYRVIDSNGDGDALDVGEVLSYADNFFGGLNDPWGLAPGEGGELLVANAAAANVLALRDKNNDGDALDVGEVVVFADGISAPVDIVALPFDFPGDYNNNGNVDAADYVLWRKGGPLANEVDNPGTVNAADYTAWRARFGNSGSGSGSGASANAIVPEPAALLLVILAMAGWSSWKMPRRRSTSNSSTRDHWSTIHRFETLPAGGDRSGEPTSVASRYVRSAPKKPTHVIEPSA